MKNLNVSDDELLGTIYEDLDIESISFLHSDTVERLIRTRLIPESVSSLIYNLREDIIRLIGKRNTAYEIRHGKEWKELRKTAQKIMEKIKSY